MIYFFDDVAVQAMEGLRRVPGPVDKLGPVLCPDRPSDGQRCMSFASSVVPLEDGRWRLYYSVSHVQDNMRGMAVAESADGRRWEKPGLGQLCVAGADTNRLAIAGLPTGVGCYGQPQVLPQPGGGWRMYFWVNQRPFLRYVVAHSQDGLRWEVADFDSPVIYHPLELGSWIWTAGVAPPVEARAAGGCGPDAGALDRFVAPPLAAAPGEPKWGHLLHQKSADELVRIKGLRSNDAVYVYRDPVTGQYEFYAPWPMCNPEGSPRRVAHDNAPFMLRSIHRRTSSDGLAWGDGELVIAPDDGDRLDQQFYYLAMHWQDGWRVGLLGSYLVHDQTMDIELCFSRDGRRWERPVRSPWVKRETAQEAGMVYAPNRLVDAGTHWLLLYTATPVRHNQLRGAPRGPLAVVCAARFPKRRFLGLAARGAGSGLLWTRPFLLGRSQLRVDARVDGYLRAELCDPFGAPLAGFGKGSSRVVSGDSTSHPLLWEGASTQHYQHNAVSLRLEVQNGEVYNIHWD